MRLTNCFLDRAFASFGDGGGSSGGGGLFGAVTSGLGAVIDGLFGGGGSFNPGVGPGGLGFLTFGGPRAEGGPVGAGRLALVGEAGPELVLFGRGGTVIPNDLSLALLAGEAMAEAERPAEVTIVQNFDFRGATQETEAALRRIAGQIKRDVLETITSDAARGGPFSRLPRRR